MSTKLSERRTTDRREAAWLVCQQAKLEEVVIDRGRVVFVFDETPDVERAVQAYHAGQATAEVKTYAGAFGYLKPLAEKAWAEYNEAQK